MEAAAEDALDSAQNTVTALVAIGYAVLAVAEALHPSSPDRRN